ncbi:VOC family protein [Xinfangfangia pollutisoli]|uniref:VOC family protein n=1 Tax=Xinfangfangia pollutisoli TaxID=2865960 RepID=UPI001CD3ED1C|nr:VOC family protein [Xinfangfangia pollutisoli]
MKLSHVSLTARDGAALSNFYRRVFGVVDLRPPRQLSPSVAGRGNGLAGVDIRSVWLGLPDDPGPFLEILEYATGPDQGMPAVNAPGFGHLAFEVPDLEAACRSVLEAGGRMQGEVVDFGPPGAPCLIVYVRDPEGNVLELEQPFRPDPPAP